MLTAPASADAALSPYSIPTKSSTASGSESWVSMANISALVRYGIPDPAPGATNRRGLLALAWVLSRGQDIVPIPGTKRRSYLEENLAAADVELTGEDIAWLEQNIGEPAGDRYADMSTVNR